VGVDLDSVFNQLVCITDCSSDDISYYIDILYRFAGVSLKFWFSSLQLCAINFLSKCARFMLCNRDKSIGIQDCNTHTHTHL